MGARKNRKPGYTIVLEYDSSHGGSYRWGAYCLELPGCVTDGRTRREALRKIREAVAGYVEVASRVRSVRPRIEVFRLAA